MRDLQARLATLPIWSGPIEVEPLAGGMTNRNLLVTAREGRFVARIAGDNRVHDIDRQAEQAATCAAARAGLGPQVLWAEPDLMVLLHIEGRTLAQADFNDRKILVPAVELLRNISVDLPIYYDGARRNRHPLAVLTRYVEALTSGPGAWSETVRDLAPLLAALAPRLAAVPEGFAHNDVHGGNLIDDGARLWLVDWEYAGQGQPLVDLASFVNNALLGEEAADAALALWFARPPTADDRLAFAAMRAAAALRDLFWGYAQHRAADGPHADLDLYIAINEKRVKAAAARL